MQFISPLKSNTLVETNPVQPPLPTATPLASTKSTRDIALQTNEVIVYKPGILANIFNKPVTKTFAATPKPQEKTKSVSIFVKFLRLIGCFSKSNETTQETKANKESAEFEKKETISPPLSPESPIAGLPGEITSSELPSNPQFKSLPEKTMSQLKNARGDLEKYYEKAGIQKKSEDIDAALKEFEIADCEWAQMKKNPNLELLFIIGDLRAIHLDKICTQLHQEYPGLQVVDRGSDDPTSDRDLSFKLPPGKESLEPTVAKKFKDLFNEAWGINSAIVFDTNPYTEFHVKNLLSPRLKQSEALKSLEMSLVMYRLTTEQPETKVHWDNLTRFDVTEQFIQQLLKEMEGKLQAQIPPRVLRGDLPAPNELKAFIDQRMGNLFTNVDDYYNNLNQQLYEAVFKLQNPNIPLPEEKELREEAQKLIKNNPSLKLNAMSDLQESNRLGARESYDQRMAIEDFLNLTDPEKFKEVFGKAIEAMKNFKTKNTQIRIDAIKREFRANETLMNKNISKLELSLDDEFFYLDNISQKNYNVADFCKKNLNKEIDDLDIEIKGFEEQISQTEKKISSGGLNPSQVKWLESKRSQLQKSLENCQQKKANLQVQLKGFKESDAKGLESIESLPFTEMQYITEELFLDQKRFDEKGRCFQVEANVTAEAFQTSIGQIPPVAGLEFILPAFTEINAFSLAHSAKHHDNYKNLIESSKYVFRQLNLISKAESSLPSILYADNNLNLRDLTGYYTGLYNLRKNPNEKAEQIELKASKQYNMPRTSQVFSPPRRTTLEKQEAIIKEETDAKTLASFFEKFHAKLIIYNMLLDKVTTIV